MKRSEWKKRSVNTKEDNTQLDAGPSWKYDYVGVNFGCRAMCSTPLLTYVLACTIGSTRLGTSSLQANLEGTRLEAGCPKRECGRRRARRRCPIGSSSLPRTIQFEYPPFVKDVLVGFYLTFWKAGRQEGRKKKKRPESESETRRTTPPPTVPPGPGVGKGRTYVLWARASQLSVRPSSRGWFVLSSKKVFTRHVFKNTRTQEEHRIGGSNVKVFEFIQPVAVVFNVGFEFEVDLRPLSSSSCRLSIWSLHRLFGVAFVCILQFVIFL